MLYSKLTNMPRGRKSAFLFVMDMFLIPISIYLAFALRLGTLVPNSALRDNWFLVPIALLIGGLLIHGLKLNRIKLDTFDNFAIIRLAIVALVLSVALIVTSFILRLETPRSVPIIFGAAFFIGALLTRVAGFYLLYVLRKKKETAVPVAIYGAGAAGIQLATALRQSGEVYPVVFVDDNPSLHKLIISGLSVVGADQLVSLVNNGKIARILIAMPSITRARQDEILKTLTKLPIEVQILPSFIDMIFSNGIVESLRTVAPDELLGRNPVDLDIPEVAKTYANRVVMVTGAGGSIGSELCRQLISCRPARIVLFEQNEFALYKIDHELEKLAETPNRIEIVTRLGSVLNAKRIKTIIEEEAVEIILHAAAYKHVPLVEANEIEGARNNIIGTNIVAQAALEAKIERFIYISTDKAVRPTSVMGATKRLAEMVIQDMQYRSDTTRFAMVRFGNVLGSSGSVLPLFQRQIAAGGPVTITHPDVTRFFMTVTEASRLVLLAGAYAKGGDFFVLDMGKPIKIIDVARRLIALSGLTVKETDSEHGNVEIRVIGLRSGEKLYEELLLDDSSLRKTPHKKIMRAEESKPTQSQVKAMLEHINQAIDEENSTILRSVIIQYVDGYHIQKA